jgi:hypothetical protein
MKAIFISSQFLYELPLNGIDLHMSRTRGHVVQVLPLPWISAPINITMSRSHESTKSFIVDMSDTPKISIDVQNLFYRQSEDAILTPPLAESSGDEPGKSDHPMNM